MEIQFHRVKDIRGRRDESGTSHWIEIVVEDGDGRHEITLFCNSASERDRLLMRLRQFGEQS